MKPLLDAVRAAGFSRAVFRESDDEGTDDEICVSDLVSVQIGCGYATVNAWSASMEEMAHWPIRRIADIPALLADVREAMGLKR